MSRRSSELKYERTVAYESGLAQGMRDALPFAGKRNVAEFPAGDRIHDCVISYEQRLLRSVAPAHGRIERCRATKRSTQADVEAAKRLQAEFFQATGSERLSVRVLARNLWFRKQLRMQLSAAMAADGLAAEGVCSAERDLEWVYEELIRVRLWLDAFVAAAEAYSKVRPGLRRTPEPEPPPRNIRMYPSSDAFVAEDSARGTPERLGGADFGYDWTWVDYERPWLVTKWRLSYIQELGELYAVQRLPETRAGYSWNAPPTRIDLPVWLFDLRLPAAESSGLHLYPTPVWAWLTELEDQLQNRPNSLLALAEAVATPPQAVLENPMDPYDFDAE